MAHYRGWFAVASPAAGAPPVRSLGAAPVRGRLAWWLVGLVLAWAVAQGALLQFESDVPAVGLANALYIAGAVVSLSAHEAVQALIARAVGLRAGRGGPVGHAVAFELREQPRACTAELAAGAAGPVCALLLSISVVVIARVAYVAGAADPLVRALAAVASFNIVIAGANLLPILPLDGGRLLRAVIWRFGHDLERASHVATVASKAAVLVIVAAGAAAALVDNVGDALSWILVGVLLYCETRAEHAEILRPPVAGPEVKAAAPGRTDR